MPGESSRRPAVTWPCLLCLQACFLLACFAWLGAVRAAVPANTGVYVEIKDSEASDAPVVERWRLYANSYALVIGIDDYTNGWPRLSNAVADAQRVAAALEARGFGVTLLKNVTSTDLREELRKFFSLKGADPDTRLFVWFSGHGYSELGEGYLVPADAPLPEQPEFLISALHMRDFGGLVRLARAKHALAVFDSCFSGTIFSVQRSRPPAAITRATVRPVRQFLTSGDADQQVADDGTFSQLVIEAIEGRSRADANGDGYLTGSELSLHLEQRVTNLTEGQQTPRSGKLRDPRYDGGDFVFLLPRKAEETRVAALPQSVSPNGTQTRSQGAVVRSGPDDATFDLEFWNAIKDSSNPASFLAYLESFPSGRFAPLARLRVNSLKQAEGEAEPKPLATEAKPSEPEPTETQLSAAERELTAWNGVKDSEDPQDLEAFLAQYPGGNFAELARYRLDRLTPKQTALVTAPPVPEPRLQPIEQVYLAARTANVRARPDDDSAKVGALKRGTEVYVRGRVEDARWLAVELDDGATGYVYAPLLAPALQEKEEPAPTATTDQPASQGQSGTQQALVPVPAPIRLVPIERRYSALKNASVRAEPDAASQRVDVIARGSTVHVAGKVEDRDWLSVERDGEHLGYVYAPLLAPGAQTPAAQTPAAQTDKAGNAGAAATESASAPSQSPQTAALTTRTNPFDGSWRGEGEGRSDTCGAEYQISLVTRGESVSGTFGEDGRSASISGRMDRLGRFDGVYATFKRIRVEFTGSISGADLVGHWRGQKRNNFGELTCAGRFKLTRQSGPAKAPSTAQASAASPVRTQSAAHPAAGIDGTWSGSGKGVENCQGDFQIHLEARGSAIEGSASHKGGSSSISGEINSKGELEKTFATFDGILVDFRGRVSGDRLEASWSGEKRYNFGEIFCRGTMTLSRQD